MSHFCVSQTDDHAAAAVSIADSPSATAYVWGGAQVATPTDSPLNYGRKREMSRFRQTKHTPRRPLATSLATRSPASVSV